MLPHRSTLASPVVDGAAVALYRARTTTPGQRMSDTIVLGGLEEILGSFDGLIVDQWGVLHDGSSLYEHAALTLERLRRAGKRVVLLSNTGRRVDANRRRLARLGLADGLVEAVVTSGEAAWSMLRDRAVEPFRSLGRHCLLWVEANDRGFVDGLPFETVDRPEAADFVLLAGFPEGIGRDRLPPELEVAAARRLPMICCNPDRVVVTRTGVIPAIGSIAARYEALGGPVHYVGKPHPPVYRLCLEQLAPLPKERVLAIGDSLEHDIAGAAGMDLETAMVASGIHASELDPGAGGPRFRATLDRLCSRHGVRPTYVLPRFAWSAAAMADQA